MHELNLRGFLRNSGSIKTDCSAGDTHEMKCRFVSLCARVSVSFKIITSPSPAVDLCPFKPSGQNVTQPVFSLTVMKVTEIAWSLP